MEGIRQVFLAVTAGELAAAGRQGLALAHMSYRVGDGPHLFRAGGPVAPQGGVLVMDDVGFTAGAAVEGFRDEVLRECARRSYTGVMCRFFSPPTPELARAVRAVGEACQSRGMGFYLSECCASAAAGLGKVTLSTALSGGSLRGRLEEAVDRFGAGRVAVWVEAAAEDFTLPSPTGCGAPLTREELERLRRDKGAGVYFDDALCAYYFTYMAGEQGHFVLFDDAASLRKKLRLAAELGVEAAFLTREAAALLMGNEQ